MIDALFYEPYKYHRRSTLDILDAQLFAFEKSQVVS